MVESEFTPEQKEFIRRRAGEVGPERITAVEQQAWPQLFTEVRAEIAAGTDARSERGRELASRWFALVEEFTGGNDEIRATMAQSYRDDPTRGGLVPSDMGEMFAWIAQGREA